MKQYLSLALIASAVFGTGCASCRDKCPFSCLSSCCSKTSCAKPKVEFVAQKPTSSPAAPKTAGLSDAEKIAQEIAASTQLETSTEASGETVAQTTVDAEAEPVPVAKAKSSPDAEVTQVSSEVHAEAMENADSELTATSAAVPDANASDSFMPPPPPAKVSLTDTLPAEMPEAPLAVAEPAQPATAEVPATEEAPVVHKPETNTFPGMVPVEALSSPEQVPSASAVASAEESEKLYEHHKDYMWVQGKMIHIYSRGGYWQVRYASYDEDDAYGGKFILVGTVPDSIKDGDFVRIRGKVLEENRWLSGTEYRIDSIQALDAGAAPVAN